MTAARSRRRSAPSPGRRLLDEAWRASLPGSTPGRVPLSAMAGGPAGSFYDGSTPDRRTVTCPDCGEAADALFGDHAGGCIEFVAFARPGSALGVLRQLALDQPQLAVDEVAAAFRAHDVRPHAAAAALVSAERRGWIVRNLTGGLTSAIVGQRIHEPAR